MQIAVIYMAAGFGRRFGSNKLLYSLNGKPLYQHGFAQLQEVLATINAAGQLSCRLIVVSQYSEIVAWCRAQGAETCLNTQAAEGITASIHLGIEAAGNVAAYAFFVADQPYLQAATIEKFLTGYAVSGKPLGCLHSGAQRGNPTIFSAGFKAELLSLQGDKGGRVILNRYPDDNLWLSVATAEELIDIDTPEINV